MSVLCDGSETMTEWKSESMTFLPTYLRTDGLTGVGARDACASKIKSTISFVRNSRSEVGSKFQTLACESEKLQPVNVFVRK